MVGRLLIRFGPWLMACVLVLGGCDQLVPVAPDASVDGSISSGQRDASASEAVPSAPRNVLATPGIRSAVVTFDAPSSMVESPVSMYVVTARSAEGSVMARGTSAPIEVTGLSDGGTYTFTVVAESERGSSEPSEPSPAITLPDVPTSPIGVNAVAGDGEATVSWTVPAADGGRPITGYDVIAAPGHLVTQVGAEATSALVEPLANGTEYTFTVLARNDVGESEPSSPSNPVTPSEDASAPPSPPINVTAQAGAGSATVSWSAPLTHGGADLLGYIVTSSPDDVSVDVAVEITSVEVPGLHNGTTYTFTVVAYSALGSSAPSSPSGEVTPADVPDAPTQVSAVAGTSQATVSWSAPARDGGASITGYTVTSSPGNVSASVSADDLTVTVLALDNGTQYTFSVRAQNAVGTGPASAPSNAVTPSLEASTVPGAPGNVTATPGAGEAFVSWTRPSDGGAVITGYTVTSSPGGHTAHVSGSTLTVAVTGLDNGTAYTFEVLASNLKGDSAPSIASNAVTPRTVPSAPSSVVAVRGNGSAEVSWAAPSSDGGNAITGYTVMASPGGVSVEVASSATSVNVGGLANGTAYTFTVVATNAAGSSTASAPSSPVTPATVPSAPTSVAAVAGDAQATVSWAAPTSTGGSAVTGYVVTSSPGGANATVSAAMHSTEVTGLTNGVAYTFTVVAQNEVGDSPASSPSASVTPQAVTVPSAPTGVYATIGNAQAAVTWSAPSSDGGSAITGYTVTSSPGGKAATVSSTSTTASVTGLTNGTAYTFTVVASNAAGDSSPSAASNSVTPSPCTLRANTYESSSVSNGCAVLVRDASPCRAARIALGLSGFWLNFSCRVTLGVSASKVSLQSDGQPDHLSNYFPTSNVCWEAATSMQNPSLIDTSKSYTMTVNKTPTGSPTFLPGVVGMAINGVILFSNRAAPGDDIYLEAQTFDKCRGHPNNIAYHHHAEPYSITHDDANFVGVMRDGYPIYGRKDADGTYPTLDAYGGHTSVTADSPSTAVYHYHVNFQTSTNSTSLGQTEWFISTGTSKAAAGTCTGC